MRLWLKEIRETKKISPFEIARKSGITYSHYNFIENGARRPSPEVAKRISGVLGFSDEWYKLLEPPN